MGLFDQSPPGLEQLHYGQAFRHAAATPLSSLLLSLELAKEHRALTNSPYVQQALDSAYHLKELFELPDKKQAQQFKVRECVQAAASLVKQSFDHAIISQRLNFPTATQLTGSRLHFQESMICVLKNAFESYASLKPGQNRVVMVVGNMDSTQLKLQFIDGGQGMGWLTKTLMFADGFSRKPQGTGVGLTWVKQVIEQHFDGQIQVQSRKRQGTTMTWLIPLNLS